MNARAPVEGGTDPTAPPLADARADQRTKREDERPLVVLIGRPNSGKSSLFNAVTGASAHVGNFPGITVDVLEADARLQDGTEILLADLPGLYSVDAFVDAATDEGVARRFLEEMRQSGRTMLLVQVADATNLGLHLRLTRELAALSLPVLVAATQSDLLAKSNQELDVAILEREVGVPVAVVSARGKNVRTEMLAAIGRALEKRAVPDATFDPASVAAKAGLAPRAGATSATEHLDAWLLHPLLGPLLFVGLMAALFAAVFLVADPVTTVIDGGIAWLRGRLDDALGNGLVGSLFADGVLGGAGTVLAFLPQIVVLTLAMELLEASGYLARGAFIVDRVLRFMGLGGRSFVPLLMSHACAVPAVAATRIVRDPRERLTTILVLPLMTCSARIPTYALIVSVFFFKASVLIKAAIFVTLYLAGALMGLIASLVLRRTAVRGKSLPLILEMPAYRMPEPLVVLRQASRAATRFVREVGTTILVASVLLWAVLTIPWPFGSESARAEAPIAAEAPEPAEQPKSKLDGSVAAAVGRGLEPITKPLGFDWRINVGLIGSFGARELMVGTLGIIFGIEDAGSDPAPLSERMRAAKRPDGEPLYPVRTGLALLAFFVIACQCMSTVAAIRRETRSIKWPLFVLGYTYAAAYLLAAVVYGVAKSVGM